MYKRLSGRKDKADILRELICNETVEKKILKKTIEFSHQTETFFFLLREKKKAAARVFNFTHPRTSH